MHSIESLPAERLKDAQQYERRLLEISRGCGGQAGCFSKRVMDELSRILGRREAEVVIHYMPPRWRSDPTAVVAGLTDIFHGGADVILRQMVP
jgi:hypothetical protein